VFIFSLHGSGCSVIMLLDVIMCDTVLKGGKSLHICTFRIYCTLPRHNNISIPLQWAIYSIRVALASSSYGQFLLNIVSYHYDHSH